MSLRAWLWNPIVAKEYRSRMRTIMAKVEEALTSGDPNRAREALRQAEPVIMRAAQQGVVHRNAASRKVSRLTQHVAKLAQQARIEASKG